MKTAIWPSGLHHDHARRVYEAQPFTVYRQYADDGTLLYVGCTDDLHRRTRDHRLSSPWWPQVGYIQAERLPNYRAAWLREFQLIKNAGPLYNIVHSRDRAAATERRRVLAESRREAS